MQKELLAAHPNTPLTVIAIWFNMVKADSRRGLAADLLTDPRVVRLWDPEHRVGQWYAKALTGHKDPEIEWDAWFLYGPKATWEDAARPLDWGRPVLDTAAQLKGSMDALLAALPQTSKNKEGR